MFPPWALNLCQALELAFYIHPLQGPMLGPADLLPKGTHNCLPLADESRELK